MCGIAGFFLNNINRQNNNIDSLKFLDIAVASLENRGPDYSNKFVVDNIGFGHTRLSIVDLHERSNQPFFYKNWILTFNGEIYNYKSIKNELLNYTEFTTNSDTEVLIKSLDIFGIEKTLEKICGMFAFAAYDIKNQELFLVRDHIGMKPLFYYISDQRNIYFASTPIAIVKGINKKFDINHNALASFFILGANFMQNSLFNRIYKIEPATYLKITKKDLIKKKYWSPKYNSNFNVDDLASICLEHENSDVNSSIFLSGGVDSSFLTAISANKNLSCIHLKSIEENYAKSVADQFQKKLLICDPNVNDLNIADTQIAKTFGEPFMSAKISYVLCAQLKKENIKMAISANGADELLFGYSRTPMFNYNLGLPFEEQKPILDNFRDQLKHIFRENINFEIEGLNFKNFSIDELFEVLKSKKLSPNFDDNANSRWFELLTYVQSDLNQSLDAASMANSVEIRTPFLDKRVISGLLSKPINELVDNKYGRKKILKKYLSKYFASSFFQRTKQGFSLDKNIFSDFYKEQNKYIKKFNKKYLFKRNNQFFERDSLYLKSSISSFMIWQENNSEFLTNEF